ncbi:MAG: hypothetical protein KGJ03_06075 [Betaproteobacteria bacterium]|nr:hypothetical protein [Betaproteobacteria bacterium]MBU6513652.1 hypothetical protein [Betaproteobacteria bacterium]MDE1955268.1 hypothetical protein [Betaproteobacteria bacterium]MDE2153207.1 hypothetical protein [Betaproteobacteria bacterium]MDE2478232.1 hypothetical protein [Betaproteobacteria bacterium]
MQITVHRGPELWREPRSMAAATYNLARTLQMRSANGVAFVPIRSLQVLAIVDREEFVFVDSQQRALALLAWERLRPDHRSGLDQPVEFEAVGYGEPARDAMLRLPREFHEALRTLALRRRNEQPATLLHLPTRGGQTRRGA